MRTSSGISMPAPPRPIRDPKKPTNIEITLNDTTFNIQK
jgi:hypothetical protein